MKQITLAAARVNAGFTQEALAEELGVTRKSVQNWESGKKHMKKSNFIAFCAVTGFDKDDIILPLDNP